MNAHRTILALVLCAGLSRAAETPPAALQTSFDAAKAAYDAGAFDKAAEQYRLLLESGWSSAALFFNWGNACYRQDRFGEAILHYRRALMLDAGDADAQANFLLATQRTGASIPEPWLAAELLRQATPATWGRLAATCWWMILLLPAARMLMPALRLPVKGIVATGLLLIGLAAAGRWCAHDVTRTPEAVLLQATDLKSAPAGDAATLVKLPEGSIVSVVEDGGTWLRVSSGKDSGWTPAGRLGRVRW